MDFGDYHDELLEDEILGRDAVWTPAGGSPAAVRVCFSLGKEELNLGGTVVPLAVDGRAGCKASAVPGAKQGDAMTIDSVVYAVLRAEPDETGWTTLYLGRKRT